MENQTNKSEATTATHNNESREWASSAHDNGGEILEVWSTDDRGERTKSIVCCIVEPGETYAEAVTACLDELEDPWSDARFDSPKERVRQVDALRWLLDAVIDCGSAWDAEVARKRQEGGSK